MWNHQPCRSECASLPNGNTDEMTVRAIILLLFPRVSMGWHHLCCFLPFKPSPPRNHLWIKDCFDAAFSRWDILRSASALTLHSWVFVFLLISETCFNLCQTPWCFFLFFLLLRTLTLHLSHYFPFSGEGIQSSHTALKGRISIVQTNCATNQTQGRVAAR